MNVFKNIIKKKKKTIQTNKIINTISPELISYKTPNYLEINNLYMSGIMIVGYPRAVTNVLMERLIYVDYNITISMFFEKINSYDVIKKLTYHIGNVNTDIKINSENKQDYEILNETYNDAKDIRRELQLNNEKIYNLYIYICTFNEEIKQLKNQIFNLESILYELGFVSKVPYYRHINLFNSILPYNINQNEIKFNSKRNMLTKTLSSFYPFISNSIFDINGILFGTNNQCKSIIIIDRFDKCKYLNSNMCIFGISGAGKSFFVKLQILRNYLLNVNQLIIDPEGEYKNICERTSGIYLDLGFSSNKYLNVFDIYAEENEKNNENFLKVKIENLLIFFSMIIPNIPQEDKNYLEEKLIRIYADKGITFENNSIYTYKKQNKIYIKPQTREYDQFPKFEDLYNIIDKKRLKEMFYQFIKGKFSYLNNYTNFDINNKTIVVNIEHISEEYMDLHLFAIIEFFWNLIKKDKEHKIVYIDELWRLVGQKKNIMCANFIVQIFKTIRKYNGGATAITQDISDLIINNNIYGKTIINNSMFKCIFKMDEENIKAFGELVYINDNEKQKLLNIRKGECLLMIDKNNLILNVHCSNLEKSIIDNTHNV